MTSWAFNKPLNSLGLRQLLIFTLMLTRIALNFHLLQKLLKLLLHSLIGLYSRGEKSGAKGRDYNQEQKKSTQLSKMSAFINNFIHLFFKCHTPSHPPITMVLKERLEGLKYNIGFGGRVGMFEKRSIL